MEPRKVAVTLVCATADAEALDDVVDGLSAVGRAVSLVGGVDEQPRRIAEAIDRCGNAGLLVVCSSPRLDSGTLRKIEGMFGARRGPNHALIRIEVTHPVNENIAAIQRAYDAFIANQSRIVRRSGTSDSQRDIVTVGSMSLPVVRLDEGEDIEGDTRRIHLPDNPKAAELSRRRRVAKERERERERITRSHRSLSEDSQARAPLAETRDESSDRVMMAVVIGAGVLAVIAALLLSGT